MDIDGVLYPMATDYRVGIAYTAELLRGNMTMQRMLGLWFPQRIPPDLEAAQEAIHAFYRCGAEKKTEAESERAPTIKVDFFATLMPRRKAGA